MSDYITDKFLVEIDKEMSADENYKNMLAVSATPTIRNISTFLKNGKTQKTVKPKEKSTEKYALTRGSAYFKRGGGGND